MLSLTEGFISCIMGSRFKRIFVAGIFVLQIGAVRHVGLPDTFQITDDFLSVQAEQGADYMSVSGAYTPAIR